MKFSARIVVTILLLLLSFLFVRPLCFSLLCFRLMFSFNSSFNCELFRDSLALRLEERVHFLLLLVSNIQKKHSIENIIDFLIVLLIIVPLKHKFFEAAPKRLRVIFPNTNFHDKKVYIPANTLYDCFRNLVLVEFNTMSRFHIFFTRAC